jgi:hypothetical protein
MALNQNKECDRPWTEGLSSELDRRICWFSVQDKTWVLDSSVVQTVILVVELVVKLVVGQVKIMIY